MITTEDGALSMAARGCPEEYEGAPATMPLLEHLMMKFKDRPLEDLEKMAERTAKDLCKDPKAWVWVALGKRRSATTVNPVYGTFTHDDWEKARKSSKPAGDLPGNQARVRAVKHWARETFPESREKMLELTRDVAQRTGGVPELDDYIDAEYHVITTPTDKKPTLISPPPGGPGQHKAPKSARTSGSKRAENKVGEPAERSSGPGGGAQSNELASGQAGQGGGTQQPAAPSGADETTLFLDRDYSVSPPTSEAAAGEGFRLDLDWHSESLQTIKWSWDTARSWLKQRFPDVNCDGTPAEVLSRLSRAQAVVYTKEIQSRIDGQQKLF
jgi:hypothetical protein